MRFSKSSGSCIGFYTVRVVVALSLSKGLFSTPHTFKNKTLFLPHFNAHMLKPYLFATACVFKILYSGQASS